MTSLQTCLKRAVCGLILKRTLGSDLVYAVQRRSCPRVHHIENLKKKKMYQSLDEFSKETSVPLRHRISEHFLRKHANPSTNKVFAMFVLATSCSMNIKATNDTIPFTHKRMKGSVSGTSAIYSVTTLLVCSLLFYVKRIHATAK